MVEDEKQPFMSHLEELRKRLMACAIAVGVGFVAAYFFKERLFELLVMPLKRVLPEGDKLIFTNLPEMFFTYLKVSFVAGLLAAMPFIFYEIWMFVAPGLYQKEKKFLIPFVISSSILFVGGALFGYFVVFPFGFKFFMSFANEYIKPLPSVKQYFSFSTKLLLAFGLVFELPVASFFLAKMGLITSDFLKKQRKFAVLLIFVAAAILTPPDVITQIMMAGPLLALYEVSIWVARVARSKKTDEEKESQEE
ncbi:MAG: twin-arginine translocase subunit TatC [Deltaproteobacteria bacterium]|nr:MAG: twin-arginine translocase subunit TatC [Deltaproteobacteria bacterium]